MERSDFFSSKSLEETVVNRKCTVSGEKINWFKFQKIIYERENPLLLKCVEYGLNNDILSISLQKRGTNEALQKLIKNIRKRFHSFYRSLKFDDSSNDFGLASRVSSDESDNEDNEI